MNYSHLIIFTISISFLMACSNSDYEVLETHQIGEPQILSRYLGDTLLFDNLYKLYFKIELGESGDSIRKGLYLNNKAIGLHKFYENKKINCLRTYVLPDPYFIDLAAESEHIGFDNIFSIADTTYLNTVVYLNESGDTNFSRSLFYEKIHIAEYADSLKLHLKFYFQEMAIKGIEFYTMPIDTSMVTISGAAGDYQKLRINHDDRTNPFKSMAIVYGYQYDQELDSNVMASRALFIEEIITTSRNTVYVQ